MTHFSSTEKRKRRKERGKKERRERKEEGGEERRKERKKGGKKCKCVFRHFQFHVVYYPPPIPPEKYKFRSGARKKMAHFSLTEKNEKKKGSREGGKKERRERKEEGREEGRKERKKGGKKRECKCVFRHFQFCVVDYPPSPQSTNSDQGLGKK